MKSESVTKAWEFYRDNCQGFKEPMRKEFRRLDEYVASLESDNAKLRELVRDMMPVFFSGSCIGCSLYDECLIDHDEHGCLLKARMRELGVEV